MSFKNNPPTWICSKCGAEKTVFGFPTDWSRINVNNVGLYKQNDTFTYVGEFDLCNKCSIVVDISRKN